ncbi:MAG: protein-glutamate O-methyltransferase CheR [Nitrospinae bacterium]|nr:protein-glutamate O-methyltransferase CheR [Nitrospinota bacterium]
MVISQSAFLDLSKIVYEYSGNHFEENKKYFFEKQVFSRMKEIGVNTAQEYLSLLIKNPKGEELKKFVEELTTNETYFFREKKQLDCFVQEILHTIKELKSPTVPINIWSAASSSGEEPYSLAILINEKFPNLNYKILGTDINRRVLSMGEKGVYSKRSLKDVPEHIISKYFENKNNEFFLKESIKRHVKFQQLNLIDNFAMSSIKYHDVIFCRNVLIYFDEKHRKKIIESFYRSLNKGGYLFLGHSESLGRDLQNFKLLNQRNNITYQK